MSTIYWKFKNTKSEFSSITFDSTHVSILDLKRAIINQKKLEQTPRQPFDLSIINAHTGVEYTDETGPIPRNLAVIVRRLPAARNQHKKLWAPLQNNSVIATADNISKKQIQSISERLNTEFGPALFTESKSNTSMEVGKVESETMNIIDMMNKRMNNGTTTVEGGRNGGMRGNRMHNRMHSNYGNAMNKDGKQSYRSQRGDPPPGYICHRCHVSGHWIQDCPTNGDPKFDKKNRPQRSHLPVPKPATPTNISGETTAIGTQQVIVGKKCYNIPTNVYESFNGDHSKIKAYIEISSGTTNNFSAQNSTQDSSRYDKYKCEICDNYFVDARFTPCCHVTYCNECIRQKSLFENPSMIKCPSCEEIFTAENLDNSQNTNLQAKVDKIVALEKRKAAAMAVPATNIINNTAKSTKTTPHTITIPQPQIMSQMTNKSQIIRPTVILKQSPPSNMYKSVTPITLPTPTVNATPAQPSILPIDTTRFEPPKHTLPNMNYTCIECGERGHKYKDCPKVAEKSEQNKSDSDNVKSEKDKNAKSELNTIQSLKDEGLDRIPKKTASDIAAQQQKNANTLNSTTNTNKMTSNTSVLNPNLMGLNNRIAPQVQLINNSAVNAASALNNLNTLNAINSVNMMNMRNRMNLNNILLNAAMHNASRSRRTGGIAPRLINSTNPLLNPALALGRMPARNGLALLQQQSLLTQQAALNRLRTLQSLSPPNSALLANANALNPNAHMMGNANIGHTQMHSAHNANIPFNLANIPSDVLQSTINELKQVMQSSDSAAVTQAINNAFVKLGANDPDSKRMVLQQLVNTISTVSNVRVNKQMNTNINSNNNNTNIIINSNTGENNNNKKNKSEKKSKKKHKKSKSKKSKRKKRDKDGHKKSKSKDRKHRHKKRKHRRDRSEKDRSRSRDRDRASDDYNTNDTDFHSCLDDENVIHVDVQSVSSKKRKLPPAPMPDFTLSPSPHSSPKHKRQKTSPNNSPSIK